jgi:hypothetical protein
LFIYSDNKENFAGLTLWYYRIYCVVTGISSNGRKSIQDITSMFATHNAIIGYHCDANIMQVGDFVTGPSGHLSFAWGYTHGFGSGGLTWNGTGFTISGSGYGSTGVEYVTPNKLN